MEDKCKNIVNIKNASHSFLRGESVHNHCFSLYVSLSRFPSTEVAAHPMTYTQHTHIDMYVLVKMELQILFFTCSLDT